MQKVKIEDLGEIKFLSNLKYNKNGKYAAFIRSEANLKDDKYTNNLYLFEVESNKIWQLTSCEAVISYNWLDDENITFIKREDAPKDDEEKTILRKIYIHGGEGSPLVTLPVKTSNIHPIGDDKYLALITTNEYKKNLFELDDEGKKEELDFRKKEKDYEVLEEIPFWSNGGTFSSKDRTALVVYDAKKDKVRILSNVSLDIESLDFNEDKSKALLLAHENKGMMPMENKLFLLDVKTLKLKELKTQKTRKYSAKFINDDLIFLLINEAKKYGLNENPKFYTFNMKNNELKPIVEDLDITVGTTVNSDMRYGGSSSLLIKNNNIYYVETNDSDAILKKMDLNGNVEVLMDKEGSVDGFTIDDNENIIAVALTKDSLQELYFVVDNNLQKISSFNDDYLNNHFIGKTKVFRTEGENTDIIKGFAIEPYGYKKGKKYPAVLLIHGGPKTVYGSVFIHEMQVLSSLGYFVFFCNPKGSDGKGNDFMDIRGRYGEIDYKNIMDFADRVLDEYEDIDLKKIGVTGGSYGGFMTNWIIGHTDKFACAVSQRSISNWISMFGTSDIGYYFADDQNLAWPWKNADKMWDHSPLKYADKVVTPTLFLHSDEDYRCWVPEGYQMFTALKIHGVESRFCLFHGENHELSRSGKPSHRIRRLNEMINWFNKYLK